MKLIDTFPARLRSAMGSRSVTSLAAEAGVSKQTISAYLTGVRKPKRVMLAELARVLCVSEAWLLGYDVPKERIVPTDSELSRRYRAAAETLSEEHLEKLTELTTLAGSLSMEQLEMAISYMKFLGGNSER